MSVVAIDLETSCRGSADYRIYREGFQIDSIAATWREEGELKSWFSSSPPQIAAFVRRLAETQRPLVVHNLSFELGNFLKLFPDLTFNWHADTLRLAQLDDNAGGVHWANEIIIDADDYMDKILDETVTERITGLALVACTSRYLPKERHDHKGPAHRWLEENHGIKSHHGKHLHLLPHDILRAYNIADTENTLLLYECLTEKFDILGYDWSADWQLYTSRVGLMQQAYLTGLLVDLDKLRGEIYSCHAEIQAISALFMEQTQFARLKWSEMTQSRPKAKRKQPDDFNVGSNTQLKELFCDVLGINIGKMTATGDKKVEDKTMTREEAKQKYPSFASKHIKAYGPLGEVLYKRRKALLVLQQMLGCYAMALESGRAHPEIRASGTATNRVSGGVGLT